MSDTIQEDSLTTGINREGMFSASKTFIEKIASAVALMCVSSVLAIGASSQEVAGLTGVKLTGAIAMLFSLLAVAFYLRYNEKKVLTTIQRRDTHD